MSRLTLVLLYAVALAVTAHEGAPRSAASSGIVATFQVVDEIFRAHVENPDAIDQVLALQRGESTATIPVGALRPGMEYNTGWSWHIDPWLIQMAEIAIELCDGRPSYVEAELDYWLYTVGTYCPWNAVLLDVIFLGDGGVGGITEPPGVAAGRQAGRTSYRPDTSVVAGLAAAGAAASAILFGGTVWRARRRRGSR